MKLSRAAREPLPLPIMPATDGTGNTMRGTVIYAPGDVRLEDRPARR
jgi:hypothetical protein